MSEMKVNDTDPEPGYNRPEIKFSLRIVFLVPFMVQIIFITGLVGYLSYRSGQKAIYEVAGRLHHEINTRISEYLVNYLETPVKIIRNNAAALSHGYPDYRNQRILEHYFWEQMRIYQSVSSITFGNSEGGAVNAGHDTAAGDPYVISSEGFTPGRLNKYSTDASGKRDRLIFTIRNFDARTRPWYRAAVRNDDVVWSDVYLFITEHDMAVSASMPVYTHSRRFLGVVSADLFLSQISRFLSSMSIGKTGVCFIMERSGQLIATSSGEAIFSRGTDGGAHKRLSAGESTIKLISSTADILKKKTGSYDSITRYYRSSIPANGDIAHAHVVPFNSMHGLNWLIATVIPEKDFMEKIEENNRLTVILIIIALAASVLIAYFTTRYITAPVLGLQSSVQDLAEGRWPETSSGNRIIEISDLKRSFHKMSRQLKELVDSLTLEIGERRQAEKALRESEEKYRELVELSNSIIIRRDITGKLIFLNEYALRYFGYTADEIIGKNIVGTLVPFRDRDGKDLQQMIHDIGAHPELYEKNENENIRKDGSTVWIVWSNRGIMDEDGSCVEILGIGTDITERRLAEQEIKRLLMEKELLLQEVHHRIKNNMNTISVLLHLQSASMQDRGAADALLDARSRVLSMMLIYDKLYDSRDFRSISTTSYFPDLINEISSTFPGYERITIETRIDDCILDSKILAPAGIIINELLTNAFKYAFNSAEHGRIEISFKRKGDLEFEIIFRDNGSGMPANVVPGKSEGFGLNLINILVRQMDGTLELIREGGTAFVINFRTDDAA